jgi:TrmH family RNA methyltransferase
MTMKLDELKKLHQKKYRASAGLYLVEGEHLILELQQAARRNPALNTSQLYVTAQHEHWPTPFTKHVISDRQMEQLADTRTPQGLIAVVPILPPAAPAADERAVYFHEIQDPGNLGTVLRTLAWFGGFRCLLSPGSVDPYNAKVVRASMGALFHVPVEIDVPADSLAARFQRIACMDLHGEPITTSAFAGCDCYVFGNEARGVPDELIAPLGAQRFTIPGAGNIESLNVASAVNMCAYELHRHAIEQRVPEHGSL